MHLIDKFRDSIDTMALFCFLALITCTQVTTSAQLGPDRPNRNDHLPSLNMLCAIVAGTPCHAYVDMLSSLRCGTLICHDTHHNNLSTPDVLVRAVRVQQSHIPRLDTDSVPSY